MALIQGMGRQGELVYGTQAQLQFSIRFMTQDNTSTVPITTYTSVVPTNLPISTLYPIISLASCITTSGSATIAYTGSLTGVVLGMGIVGAGIPIGAILTATNAGTSITINLVTTASATVTLTANVCGYITIAGTPIQLLPTTVVSPMAVAQAIKTAGVAGFNVAIDQFNLCLVKLQAKTPGPITLAQPICYPSPQYSANDVIFYDIQFTQGVPMSASSPTDDILLLGKQPVTLSVLSSATTTNPILASNGIPLEQQSGTLPYGAALTLTGQTVGILPTWTMTYTGTTTSAAGIINIDGVPVYVATGQTPAQVATAVIAATNQFITPFSITTTGTYVTGGTTVTLGSVTGVLAGMSISGNGIPYGTYILSLAGSVATLSNTITISAFPSMMPAGFVQIFNSLTTSGMQWVASSGGSGIVTLRGTTPVAVASVLADMGSITGVGVAPTTGTTGVPPVAGIVTLTTPTNYVKVTTTGTSAVSQVKLLVTR